MRLAETARSRWVLALASLATAGTAVALIARCPTQTSTGALKKTALPRFTACKQKHVAPVVKPPTDGELYSRTLLTARPGYEACTAKQPAGVTYAIRMPIDARGRVTSVEVRGEADDLRKVDLKVVKCLETVSSHLRFPATGAPTAVSTAIRTK